MKKDILNTQVDFIQKDDPDQPNNVILTVNVDKKEKVKIGEITFVGNEYFDDTKLRRQMKDTKKKNLNFFRSSKFISTSSMRIKINYILFIMITALRILQFFQIHCTLCLRRG